MVDILVKSILRSAYKNLLLISKFFNEAYEFENYKKV